MPTILGANSVSGYEISNSLRFNDDDSAHLSRTVGTPTNQKIYTFSVWTKKSNLAHNTLIGTPSEGDTFDFGDRVQFHTNGSADSYLRTNRLFRDMSAWYHLVIAYNTEQSTAANRVKFYINGVQYAWDLSTTFPTEDNTNGQINKDGQNPLYIGRGHAGEYAEGYMADFNLIDGQQLDPSYFGETNDDGIWVPKKYTGTYGNNGFFLEFKQTGTGTNASGMGADTSGNGNHFAVVNLAATDVTTDTPTNNFATLNPLTNNEQAFSEGATKTVKGGNAGTFATSTFEVNKGKWYFESKLLSYSSASRPTIGLSQSHNSYTAVLAGAPNNRAYYLLETSYYQSNSATAVTVDSSPATNDIYMWGVDLDNLKFYIGKNGTWLHSSDPSAGSNGLAIQVADYYSVATSPNDNGTDNTRNNDWFFNFGNPAFAISSSNADGNGYGNFEYAVPTGFYSYCTKNLAQFG